ncbi:hypothetical protein IAT40_002169 [Kwoniella sp. CBS 6097]
MAKSARTCTPVPSLFRPLASYRSNHGHRETHRRPHIVSQYTKNTSANTRRPTAPFTARPHGANLPESRFGVFEYTYANLQPIFDLTSAAFPTGLRQDPAIDVPESSFEPRSKLDQTVHDLCKFEDTSMLLTLPDTDPSEWEGAPIGLQLFARRFEEEKVLAMLGIIKEALA